jgi:GH15 family glucan-1,4-alpha-glucosidase
MQQAIEDYALIGDCHSAALVGRNGSIDWLCIPRFDSHSCFAAILGDEDAGYWKFAPLEPVLSVDRRYRPGTLILETRFETAEGVLLLTDFMPPRTEEMDLIRLVSCEKAVSRFVWNSAFALITGRTYLGSVWKRMEREPWPVQIAFS